MSPCPFNASLKNFVPNYRMTAFLQRRLTKINQLMVIAAIAEAEGHPLSAEALEAEMSGSSPGIDKKPGSLY